MMMMMTMMMMHTCITSPKCSLKHMLNALKTRKDSIHVLGGHHVLHLGLNTNMTIDDEDHGDDDNDGHADLYSVSKIHDEAT